MIELVVFDIAGTTVREDDAVNSSFGAALGTAGIKVEPAVVNTVMGLRKKEAIGALLTHAGKPPIEEQVEAIHDDFVRRMLNYYATTPSVEEIPGAEAAFTALRASGIKVALNTGFNRAIANVLLARLGWEPPWIIDASVTSDEVPHGRPHPDMIRLLMSRLGIRDAGKIAKVGDTRVDLEEGANAGCGLNIGVTSGSFTREQLQKYPHTHIVGSVAEVPAIVFSGAEKLRK